MKTLNFLFIASAALLISACAFDKNSNPSDRKAAEDYAYLKEKHSHVTGVYEGSFKTTDGGNQILKVTLTSIDVPAGTNERGENKIKRELRARFSFESTAKPDVLLDKVDYLEETNPPQIIFASTPNAATNPDLVSATLNIYGDTLQGTVVSGARTLGTANLKLVTRDTDAPGAGDQNEENLRLIRLYTPLTGTYSGIIAPPSNQGSKTEVIVEINVGWKNDPRYPAEDRKIPTLIGLYRRALDPDKSNTLLSIQYLPDSRPLPTITISSVGSTVPNGHYEVLSIYATVKNNVIEGTYQGASFKPYKIRLEKQ
jgi:hypothetical protein